MKLFKQLVALLKSIFYFLFCKSVLKSKDQDICEELFLLPFWKEDLICWAGFCNTEEKAIFHLNFRKGVLKIYLFIKINIFQSLQEKFRTDFLSVMFFLNFKEVLKIKIVQSTWLQSIFIFNLTLKIDCFTRLFIDLFN